MKILKSLITISALFFGLFSVAQEVELPIDGAHSVISFSVGFAGGISSIDGRFNDFEGTIGYKDKNDQTSLYCDVIIDVNSLNTGNSMRDQDLKGAGWFNMEEFPSITFSSTKTEKTEDGFALTGKFTMMGIEEEITIPFTYQHPMDIVFVFGEPRIAALGTFQLDRTKYGIPKRGFGNIVPALGTLALLKEVEIKLMIMGRGPAIGGLVLNKINADGVIAGIAFYEDMEKKHAGKDTYNFGENTVSGLANNLIRSEKFEDAVAIGEYCTKRYPESAMAHYILGATQEKNGNTSEAIKGYEKSLELNPEFGRAKKALELLMEAKK